MRKGFTLIELLAVIAVLAIILIIAVPQVLMTIEVTNKQAFGASARMIVENIATKMVESSTFNPTTINETNIKTILGVDDSNYAKVYVTLDGNIPNIVIKGKNKWSSYFAFGNKNTMNVHDNLLLFLDASNTNSYSGSGISWLDLSGNAANATLNGTTSFVNAGYRSYFLFPSNALDTDYISTALTQSYKDFFIVFEPDYTTPIASGISMLFSSGGDKSLRFTTGSTPWSIASRNPGDTNDWASVTSTDYYINGTITNTLPASGWVLMSGARTNTASFPDPFAVRIGGGYTGRNFPGKVAFLAMYNKKLSVSEVNELTKYFRIRFGV